jgi:formylglycine-generating enzyme required for sulfatase activity
MARLSTLISSRRSCGVILCAALWFCFSSASWAQNAAGTVRKKALIIGNGVYDHLPPLRTPLSNADALAAALKALRVETTSGIDLTRDALSKTLQTFAGSIQPGDVVFFYFSGYALQGKGGYSDDDSEEDWLLPTNFDPQSPRKIAEQGIAVSRVAELLNDSQAGTRIIVVDAGRQCCEGRRTGIGLRGQSAMSQTLVAYATALGDVAKDPPDGAVNVFTSQLISALQEPGLAAPTQTFDRVQQRVMSATGGLSPYINPGGTKPFYFVDPPPPVTKTVVVEKKETIKPGELRVNIKDNLQYAWIPSGSFKMGCVPGDRNCAKDESPRRTVSLKIAFWITNTEVTVSAYDNFMKQTGHSKPSPTKTNPKLQYTEHPVTKVTWQDAEDYCEWTNGRLPTEAEWEYAARAGKDDNLYPWGDKFDPKLCNSFRLPKKLLAPFSETLPVRHFIDARNAWSLFDVIGNVREYVWDAYDPNAYQGDPTPSDPRVEAGPGNDRISRGGAWGDSEKQLRLSARYRQNPKGDNQTGFRCLVPKLPE